MCSTWGRSTGSFGSKAASSYGTSGSSDRLRDGYRTPSMSPQAPDSETGTVHREGWHKIVAQTKGQM
eukprot:3991504-Alexandrium_andersonii.AAC.1